MHKTAPTDFPVHDFIAERWSPRAFSDESVPTEVLGASLKQRAGLPPAVTSSLGRISSALKKIQKISETS